MGREIGQYNEQFVAKFLDLYNSPKKAKVLPKPTDEDIDRATKLDRLLMSEATDYLGASTQKKMPGLDIYLLSSKPPSSPIKAEYRLESYYRHPGLNPWVPPCGEWTGMLVA